MFLIYAVQAKAKVKRQQEEVKQKSVSRPVSGMKGCCFLDLKSFYIHFL